MVEIVERHMEWATVDRMRQMLDSTRRDFEITQTYTLFTSILCWTLQRIRWHDDDTELAGRMRALRERLETQEFYRAFPRLRPPPMRVVDGETRPLSVERHNGFGPLLTEYPELRAMDVLVALRNAVAHGDARRVRPINRNGRLQGYELHCMGRTVSLLDDIEWSATVRLSRGDMASLARKLAEDFCDAAIPSPFSTDDTEALRVIARSREGL